MATSDDINKLTSAIKSLEVSIKGIQLGGIAKLPGAGGGGKPGDGPSLADKRRAMLKRRDTMSGFGSISEDAVEDNTGGVERTVYIRVVFLKIGEIDTIHEKYGADVFVHGRWREPLLDNKKGMDPDEMDWTEYWTANLVIENALGDCKEETWYAISHDELGRAMVYEKKRVKGSFLENLELNQFPFDTQDLTITVSSDRGEHEVSMVEDDKEICGLNLQSFVDEQEWELHNHVDTWTKVTTKVFQNAKHKHPALSAACKASRRPGFFIYNVICVMSLICSLSFAIFAVGVEKIPNRLQLSFILLLTTVTFKFVVTHNLPKISYLTYLDKYILGAMLFLCTLALWHVIAFLLNDREVNSSTTTTAGNSTVTANTVTGTTATEADFIAFCVLLSLWICFQLFFVLWICCMNRYNKKSMAKKQQVHEKKMEKYSTPNSKNSKNGNKDIKTPTKQDDISPNGWMRKGKIGHEDVKENDAEAMEVGMVAGLGAD